MAKPTKTKLLALLLLSISSLLVFGSMLGLSQATLKGGTIKGGGLNTAVQGGGLGYTLPYDTIGAASNSWTWGDAESFFLGSSTFGYAKFTTSEGTKACVKVPIAGTLKGASIYMWSDAAVPSNEATSFYVRHNDTTDVTLTTTADLSTRPYNAVFTGLSQAVSSGDCLVLKVTTPTYATNPGSATVRGVFYIE